MRINFEVMTDTANCCEEMPELKNAIEHSIGRQYMVAEEDKIELPVCELTTTKYWCRANAVSKLQRPSEERRLRS